MKVDVVVEKVVEVVVVEVVVFWQKGVLSQRRALKGALSKACSQRRALKGSGLRVWLKAPRASCCRHFRPSCPGHENPEVSFIPWEPE